MQIQAPEEKTKLVKLSQLADDINSAFRESNEIAVEAIRGSAAAVKAAIRAGAILTRAKKIVGHGNWGKWLADNCPNIDERTAQRWMGLAKTTNLSDLSKAKTLTAAYRAVGMIPEPEKEKKGIGTAPVDIFAELFRKFDKGLGPVIDIAADVDPADMPAEQRKALLERARPMIEFVERVEAVGIRNE